LLVHDIMFFLSGNNPRMRGTIAFIFICSRMAAFPVFCPKLLRLLA
jgi:hypothetical protein